MDNLSMETLITKAIDVLSEENLIVEKYSQGSFSLKKITEQGWAFSVIMKKSKHPVDDMIKITRTGSYYGLIGLYKLDKTKYLEERDAFKFSDSVIIQTGDIIDEIDPKEFLENYMIKKGDYLAESLLFDELPDWEDTRRIKQPYRTMTYLEKYAEKQKELKTFPRAWGMRVFGDQAEQADEQSECVSKVNYAQSTETEKLIAKAIDVLSNENFIVGKYKQESFSTKKPSEQGWAFSVIMKKSKHPVDEMIKLARTGSYYGLIGLYNLDKAKYLQERNGFRIPDTVIIYFKNFFYEIDPEDFITNYIIRRGDYLAESLLFDELPDWEDTRRIKQPYRTYAYLNNYAEWQKDTVLSPQSQDMGVFGVLPEQIEKARKPFFFEQTGEIKQIDVVNPFFLEQIKAKGNLIEEVKPSLSTTPTTTP